jgi:hypothetical protein
MLPDYPKVKGLIAEAFRQLINNLHNQKLGIFSSLKATTLHEGSTTHTYRPDGTFSETEMKHVEATAQLEHDIKQLETLEVKDIFKLAEKLADGIAREKHKLFIQRLDEACQESGNVMSGKKPLVEQVLEGFEKILLEFEPDGKLSKDFMFYCHPQMAPKLAEAHRQIESDPQLKKRLNAIMERKRQEWRDREAARNLAE